MIGILSSKNRILSPVRSIIGGRQHY